MDQSSSLLLDIDGLVVDQVVRDDVGRRVVHCSTDPQLAGWCPECGEQSRSPKAWVTTRPRDVRLGEDRPILLWRKRKWRCQVDGCERKVFTECLPEQIPARARITTRARRLAAEAIGDHTRPVSGVAAEFGMDWRVAHDAFVAHAAQVLPEQPPPVTVLGVDETRRGKAHYETDPTTGAKTWVDRFDTGLVDLSGNGGLFAQVNGRTSKVLIEWLQAQDPDWLANITHISMDTSATYARAARLALPDAVVVVDRFHLSALANKAVTDYRRELAWALRGRRGRKSDPEWAQRNRLLRAAESLTDDELAKVQDAMRRADPSGGLEKCWQGKELLRKLLKLAGTNPDRGRIFNALTAFYLHCADSGVAQLRRLAWTVHAWQNSIIAGLHTGISNGRTEGYNRIVKHIGRIAFGFRNQDNQKRRVRYACTRKSRASTSHAKPC
ncbi:transposase IS204/IS1001/IS1096/IS1165 family protein [Nakamurella multipartita DSM 44233]|jgi:transposase|uniref:Transposase IS204/IS1001/IS1096/IS1165 family protein n=1 Tax=Nakamurella multipartita (strain ATCC 700099 / DSM 44233 / CIP 104796 / JCM 9543 / NBRC 105858 / Y-104) TaxID=479431 RepID=C8X711_NAKMY|nr:transposase IS204/IS1001/IS1096/IS1165 family protein [Nakamurella multipartita DSM 44233]ACV76958.1 transposase IS204/IS1001/IS1096/IS1165 family protein [Nakamurella multipartita DSM 44233]ACV78155.1 transposase IS204/IS1001/IS1096/IS1165 family protein [Nakamurella multipartita DSM 44233]ACV78353.1 transposase IS204/IS1001/IS1096/IS1165 family protein [Nakamurella multipartita DSM 44233]ACV79249.1 transposase IS204/IS1001/IS1096/IS1165 family protein [Nakamurella multipartita DSM 44233]